MIDGPEGPEKRRNTGRPELQKKVSDGTHSMISDFIPAGDCSALSAISSQLQEDKNKEYYDLKNQYLNDEIFFAKLQKKNANEPLMTGNQMSLNREESSKRSIDSEGSWLGRLDFLKAGSLATTVVLLMVSTIGGGKPLGEGGLMEARTAVDSGGLL